MLGTTSGRNRREGVTGGGRPGFWRDWEELVFFFLIFYFWQIAAFVGESGGRLERSRDC